MVTVHNFSPGPAVLPRSVLERAAAEMLDYGGSGLSVMEMSHRSTHFEDILFGAEARLRQLMAIPSDYDVVFMQGGASLQFAMVPMNLLERDASADYAVTGSWSKKALKEAQRFGKAHSVISSEAAKFTFIPKLKPEQIDPNARYLHITSNNTIYGTQWHSFPETDGIPLVADMSSDILSRPIDVSKFGLIYAGAQKNMGPAGVTVVILAPDMLKRQVANLPTMLDYQTHIKSRSLFHTPPTYSIYMMGLVLEWIEAQGGLEPLAATNARKAKMLYDHLDSTAFFYTTVVKEDRSLLNVPFTTGDPAQDAAFVSEATKAGLQNLKGHRLVGGMRASLYNALTPASVEALVAFMRDFEARKG